MKKFCTYLIMMLSLTLGTCALASAQDKAATGKYDAALLDAVTMINSGRYDEAVKLLKPLATACPSNDAVYYYLGLGCSAMQDLEEAITYMQEAVRLDTSNFWYKDRLARLYGATSQPELAIDIYESIIASDPSNYEVYYSLVSLYAQQNKPDKMLSTLDEIESIMGKTEQVTLSKYDILMRQQKPDEAYAVLKNYNDEFASAQILSAMGEFNLSNYSDTLALECFKEALSYESDCSQALIGAAEIYRYWRNYPEFFKLVTEFVSNDGSPAEVKANYMRSFVQHSDPRWLQNYRPQMDTLMSAFTTAAPADSSVLQVAGTYYLKTERPEDAVRYFKTSRECNPQSRAARYFYVQVLGINESWDELISEAESAYVDFPDIIDFIEIKNAGLYSKGDLPAVVRECERLIVDSPRDSAALLYAFSTMGDVYHQLGDSGKSYAAYEKALKVNMVHCPVLNNYAYYLCTEGKKLKKALSMSRITVEIEPDNPTYLDTLGWILYLLGKPAEAKPYFKHAMLYGGKDSAAVLDHYAEVLYALGDYDTAKVYWNLARNKNEDNSVPDLEERIQKRLDAIRK